MIRRAAGPIPSVPSPVPALRSNLANVRDDRTPVPRWVWAALALSGLSSLLSILGRRSEPWVLWLGIGIAAATVVVVLILIFGFPHLVADEGRNSRVFLAIAAIGMVAVAIYAVLNLEP